MVTLAWLACGSNHGASVSAVGANDGGAVEGLVGTWVGAPCGERTWERTYVFDGAGRYQGTDPISPCPPGAQCIWSGVIAFEGSWTATGSRVDLVETPANRPPMARAYVRPATLDYREGSLYDPEGCRYVRAPG